MRRAIRILDLIGIPVLALGLAFLDLLAGFACWEGCSDADLAPAITARLGSAVPIALISAVPVTVAWVDCLIQLMRQDRRGVAVALALALPLAATLALALFYVSTGGTWIPTSWAARYNGWGWGWDVALGRALALLLLWPAATFAATFALRRR
jgi:hypothetical protein